MFDHIHISSAAIRFSSLFPPSKQARNQGWDGMFLELNFTGKEMDCETGFSYFGARYYDPTLLTSWTAVDPMSDDYPNMSPYHYCHWNPLVLKDPNGMWDANVNGWWKDKKGSMHWDPHIHNQQELNEIKGTGNVFMGLTYEENGKYYSLFGDIISTIDKKQRVNLLFTKKMDELCKNVQKGYNNSSIDYISSVSFKGIYAYDKYDNNTHSTNFKSEGLQKYAQGKAGIVLYVSGNMDGNFLEYMRQNEPKTTAWGMGGFDRNSLIKGWNIVVKDKKTQQIFLQLAFPTEQDRSNFRKSLETIVQ